MIVRPPADVRRRTRPGDTRRSDCSPGTSNVAVALPAGGTGSTNEPRPGDVVMWDNTGTLHRARPYPLDSGRLMHRTKLAGEEPFA